MEFAVVAETTGWVGLGLSLDGSMPNLPHGNDIALGWVTTSGECANGCLFDMYTAEYQVPSKDEDLETPSGDRGEDNLVLVSAAEIGPYTILEFVKPIESNDPFDVNSEWFSVHKEFFFTLAMNENADPFDFEGTTYLQKHASRDIVRVLLTDPKKECNPVDVPTHTLGSPDGKLRIEWKIVQEEEIEFTLKFKGKGWVSVGLNSAPSMIGADMMIGWVEESGPVLLDSFSEGHREPTLDTDLDGANDLLLIRGETSNGEVLFTFRRKLITDDMNDFDIEPEADTYLLWAYGHTIGSGKNISKHAERGVSHVNLFLGSQSSPSVLYAIHGSIMLLVWLPLFSTSVFIARYLKTTLGHIWFRAHVGFYIVGALMMAISLLIIVSVTGTAHLFLSYHSISGFILVLLFLLQGSIGYMADKVWRLKQRYSPHREESREVAPPPFFGQNLPWDLLHGINGRLTYFVAMITIVLGLNLLGLPRVDISVWILVSSSVVVLIGTALLLEQKFGKVTHAPKDFGAVPTEPAQDHDDADVIELDEVDPDNTPHLKAKNGSSSGSGGAGVRNQPPPSSYFSSPTDVLKISIPLVVALLLATVIILLLPRSVPLPLLSPPVPRIADTCVEAGDCIHVNFTFPNREVSTARTEYTCTSFRFPIDRNYHIVKIEPIVDDPALVHHISLYASDAPYSRDEFFACQMTQKIYHPYYIYFWGIGMPPYYYPDDMGFKVGRDGVKHVWLQIHYNNPMAIARQFDSSGLRLTLSSFMRPTDVSTLRVGAALPQIRIPPKLDEFVVEGKCALQQSLDVITHPITLFANSFHMHTLGVRAVSRLIRDGEVIAELGRDDSYQFFAQTWDEMEPIQVLPGDEIETTCVYKSSHRNELVKGGFSALDEMCWNTFMFYPPLEIQDHLPGHCISSGRDWEDVPLI
eukprot:TRINITY_DN374_c0_g2_i1.p1 TRINITY_DN374_c0_g2~~TRINITY_DN374_c0_g2_i1.p1  ORF type:complete len:1008 (-),score=217.47 TRINITY_DN374_c0_g2_i1:156-2915(-)